MSTQAQAQLAVAKPAEIPALSEMQRLVNVFWSPSKTFTDLRRKSSWWVPFLLISVLSIVYISLISSRVGWTTLSMNNLSRQNPDEVERLDNLPADQRQESIAVVVKVTKSISYASPVVLLFLAGRDAFILLIVLGIVASQRLIGFGRLMAIEVYASLTSLVKVVVVLALFYAGVNSETFVLVNPIDTNPGYFFGPGDLPRYVISVLSQLDLFTIWHVALVGIGIAYVARIKRSTALLTAFGCWLGWVLLIAAVPGF